MSEKRVLPEESSLKESVRGLPFRDNRAFCKFVGELPAKVSVDVMRELLTQAVDRISRDVDVPPWRVADYHQTSTENPSQWDGRIDDGEGEPQPFFIRYRDSELTLFVDDKLVEFIEVQGAEDPNRMGLDRAAGMLAHRIAFPDLHGAKLVALR